jgi:hypothetical protein
MGLPTTLIGLTLFNATPTPHSIDQARKNIDQHNKQPTCANPEVKLACMAHLS